MAFAVLIAMLIGIGQSGLRRMKEIDENLKEITGKRSEKRDLAQEALTFSNRNSRITMEIFLEPDKTHVAALLATRANDTRRISELIAEIANRCDPGKEKQLLATVQEARRAYVDSYLRALHLLAD
ncbi:MAG: MCP four helix bundle domain-containing protein, partial [Candidatus Sulfotelmatobacter sp.]